MVNEMERRCVYCGVSYPVGDLYIWENRLLCRFCLMYKENFVACLNLATGKEKLVYNTTPEDAVYHLARLEPDNQELKIWHGEFSVSCGNWAAMKKEENDG